MKRSINDAPENSKKPRTDEGEQVAIEPFKEDLSRSCPYLVDINRNVLDFDFEKLCSISLSHLNVYACLICGKYFQGRGVNTHAHTHSLSENHYVFLNLENHKYYCLPDNYEIIDNSLEDITYLLNPTFTKTLIWELDLMKKYVRAYNGSLYYPGVVGLNNIKENDYCNVIIQMLSHMSHLRNFFLDESHYMQPKTKPGDQRTCLLFRFGELIRKLWNPRNFKNHVSPHEFLQTVVIASKKRFQFTQQSSCVEFLSWFLSTLEQILKGCKDSKGKPIKGTIISKCLRGTMYVHSRKLMPMDISAEKKMNLANDPEYSKEVCTENKFLFLTCDLPPPPLFQDELKENIIPQVPLATLLQKFNGITEKEYRGYLESHMKRFSLQRLPPYLCLFIKRILKNVFTLEKNPTIVNFPVKGVNFGELLSPEILAKHKYTTYNLIANVVHDGPPTNRSGSHRIHILHKGTEKWFEMQDLHVKEILPQMITLSESLVQIWEVDRTVPNPHYKPIEDKAEEEMQVD